MLGAAGLLISMEASTSRGAAITAINTSSDHSIFDWGHNGSGDGFGSGNTEGRVAFATASGGTIVDYVFAFAPTPSQRAAILAAGLGDISLNVNLTTNTAPSQIDASLWGLTGQTDATVGLDDMYASAISLADPAVTPASTIQTYSFDVTSFAKDQLAANPNNILKFRIQPNGEFQDPGTAFWQYKFENLSAGDTYPPTLTVVPEPFGVGTAGMIFVGVVLAGWRQRRKGSAGV
jgi:hypothetical protein